ncbi:MAG TPA: D-tyrosyl-tRNA(Tyr) deacylase [Verrucomicrobia bacterium]|nr:MAG: D-tyrosyl-tRNA(Tyr) deacylase [Lentisphaerae bacterium GWF2_57_35]HBA85502.1 D-tyrosyl-tRNA(Tyr) deacylase [Verrucomicrobiota bacterium]
MKLLVQRVLKASVTVGGRTTASIGPGMLVLVGIACGDNALDASFLARKAAQLRIFNDEQGKMNRSIDAVHGEFLAVSQFTLYGDCAGGNRPSYTEAAAPDEAKGLYEQFVVSLRAMGHRVHTGEFREHMLVESVNDGPVTLILESRGRMTS